MRRRVLNKKEEQSFRYTIEQINYSTTWTVPANCLKIDAFLVGGGGGGGAHSNTSGQVGLGGNGGACVLVEEIPVVSGESISVSIGNAGSRGVGVGNSGTNGGTTSITYKSHVYSAAGGKGGRSGNYFPDPQPGHSLGGGSWNVDGTDGEDGKPNPLDLLDENLYGAGGGGGSNNYTGYYGASSGGKTGGGGSNGCEGQPATFFGAGGGGGSFNANHSYGSGGNGYKGIVILRCAYKEA